MICKRCKKENVEDAKFCSNCASSLIKKPVHKRPGFWILMVIIVFVILVNMGSENQPTTSSENTGTKVEVVEKTTTPVIVLEPTIATVDELMEVLNSNALKASATYKDSYVELTGKLSNIDSSGNYFTLYNLTDTFMIFGVNCNISKDHLPTVMDFKIGQEVTVIGTITSVGEVIGYSLEVESIK